MPQCHWTAREIYNKMNSSDENALTTAEGMLRAEMTSRSNDDFIKMLEDLRALSKADSNDSNDVYYEKNSKGEVSAVYINDGTLWDTKICDRKHLGGVKALPSNGQETLNMLASHPHINKC